MSGESKYAPLAKHLAAIGAAMIDMALVDLDALLSGGLPASAYRYRTWWTSNADATAQSRHGWRRAGYLVSQVDLSEGTVVFTRC
jgi:hypothetical protein